VPKTDCNRLVKVSEWDSDQGNNRIYSISRTFDREFKRLLAMQPKNAESYTAFLKRTRIEGIGVVRRLNYIRALQALVKANDDFLVSELSSKEIDRFLEYASRNSQATLQLRFYCLKKYLEFIGKENLLKGIKVPKKQQIKVKASDLLTREDVQSLIEACSSARGRAFISMLYESGARIGEILNIELKDMEFDSNGVLVEINGKTGKRRIRLVESAGYLRKWVTEIRQKHPKAVYLWFGEDEFLPSKYAATTKFLRKTAKLAGIRKKVNPHIFRHSRASELAQKLREPQLRAFMGWGASSDMPEVYIHLSGRDVDNAILRARGADIEEIKQVNKFKPVKCPNCRADNIPGTAYCMVCDFPLDESIRREMNQEKQLAFKILRALQKTPEGKRLMEEEFKNSGDDELKDIALTGEGVSAKKA